MFTNFENRNTINKKASRLLFRKHAEFLDRSALGDPLTKYTEKSIRDVYGALQMDFDPLDEMLTGSTNIRSSPAELVIRWPQSRAAQNKPVVAAEHPLHDTIPQLEQKGV